MSMAAIKISLHNLPFFIIYPLPRLTFLHQTTYSLFHDLPSSIRWPPSNISLTSVSIYRLSIHFHAYSLAWLKLSQSRTGRAFRNADTTVCGCLFAYSMLLLEIRGKAIDREAKRLKEKQKHTHTDLQRGKKSKGHKELYNRAVRPAYVNAYT